MLPPGDYKTGWNAADSSQSGIPLDVSRIVENAEVRQHCPVRSGSVGGLGGGGGEGKAGTSGGQACLGQAICGLHTSLTLQLS